MGSLSTFYWGWGGGWVDCYTAIELWPEVTLPAQSMSLLLFSPLLFVNLYSARVLVTQNPYNSCPSLILKMRLSITQSATHNGKDHCKLHLCHLFLSLYFRSVLCLPTLVLVLRKGAELNSKGVENSSSQLDRQSQAGMPACLPVPTNPSFPPALLAISHPPPIV